MLFNAFLSCLTIELLFANYQSFIFLSIKSKFFFLNQNTLQTKFRELKKEKLRTAYRKYPPRNSFSHFLSAFDPHNHLEKEDSKRKELMKISAEEMYDLALCSFETQTKQLTSWASETIKNVLDNHQTLLEQNKQELITTKTLMNEKDQQLKALKNKSLQQEEKINRLIATIASFEAKLEQLKKDNDNSYSNASSSSQKLLTSTQQHIVENFHSLQTKYANLEETNLTQAELLALKRTELKEYIKLAEYLSSKQLELEHKIKGLKIDQLANSFQIDQLTNDKINLAETLELYQKEKANWEKEKADAKESLRKWQELEDSKLAKFNRNAFENAQLKSKLIEKEQTIKEGIKHVKNLDQTIVEKNSLIKSLRENLQRENRKKKVLTVSNWIRYGSSYFVNERLYSKIDTTITSATSYYVVKDFDNWSYELIFMLLGVLTWKLTKKAWNCWKDQRKEKEVIEIRNQPKEIEVVEMKEAKNLT